MRTLHTAYVRQGVKRAIAMSLVLMLLSWTSAFAQPPWQPQGQPSTGRINGTTWTTTTESREYTKEDGTKVTESRTTTTKTTDGKTQVVEQETVTKEQKGDDKSETRKKEKTDSEGKKKTTEQKTTDTKTPEGTKHTVEFWEDGKLVGSGTSTTFDPPRGDGTVTEEESITYDKDGKPVKKTKYRYLKDGTVLIDEYFWDPKTGTWGKSTGTKIVKPVASKVVAPSTCTSGYAVGGTVKQGEIKSTAGGTIVAEKTDGEKQSIDFDMTGKWEIPSGLLGVGVWLISALMPDGTKGEPSVLQVLPDSFRSEVPNITASPGMTFTGSAMTLAGSGLVASDAVIRPSVWFTGAGQYYSVEPTAYSDREIICDVPQGAMTGDTKVFVNNGGKLSNAVQTDIVSFEISVPAVTKVNVPFNVTVMLKGLTGDYAKRDYNAELRIVGPAKFTSTMAQEGTVTLKGGVAQVGVIADAAGAFNIQGTLLETP